MSSTIINDDYDDVNSTFKNDVDEMMSKDDVEKSTPKCEHRTYVLVHYIYDRGIVYILLLRLLFRLLDRLIIIISSSSSIV